MAKKLAGLPLLEEILKEAAKQGIEAAKGFGIGLTLGYAAPTSLRNFLDMSREDKTMLAAGYIPGALVSIVSAGTGAGAFVFETMGAIELHGIAKLLLLPLPAAVIGSAASAGYELFRYARQRVAGRYRDRQ